MLAIETLLGALTGYFTNDIAIRQLFAKNGVVVRERAQFTDMIVQVLEDQIIDEDTVQSLRDNPEMATVFRRFVRDLLMDELPYVMSDCALADIDVEGRLRDFLQTRVACLGLSEASVDAEVLQQKVMALLMDEGFKNGLREALENVAALSLSDLGAARVLGQRLSALGTLEASEWALLLDRWEQRLQAAVADFWQKEPAAESLCLKDVLPIDGEQLVAALEGLLLSQQAAQQDPWLDVLKNPAVQEHVYVLAERLLEEVLATHLPSLVETFAPLLVEDRAIIEQMVLESVAECPEAGDFIREAVLAALRGRFAEEQDGSDWLTALLDHAVAEDTLRATSHQLAQFLLSWVVSEIDHWRQVGADDEEAMQALRQRWLQGRAVVVRLVDRMLTQSLKGLLSLPLMQALVHAVMDGVREWLTPQQLQALQGRVQTLLNQPLSHHLLTPEKQERLVTMLPTIWQEHGQAVIASLPLSGADLNAGAEKLIDWLYQQPLARLMCSGKDAVPYDTIADALMNVVFDALRPFLGKMTKEQLDALSHEEIRELTLDMVGREMRPLTYLGGGVGAVVGAATGVAMEMSGVTPDPDQVAALMAARVGMYGVVGYGTNVAAVTGLFRPYRKLGPIQGLMSKNQTRFARKMKELAESYIINEDIWAAQVARFSAHIDANFDALLSQTVQRVTQADDARWQRLLDEMLEKQAGGWLRVAFNRKRVGALLRALDRRLPAETLAGQWAASQHPGRTAVQRLALCEAASGALSQTLAQGLRAVSSEAWVREGNAALAAIVLPSEAAAFEDFWQRYGQPEYRLLPERLLAHTAEMAGLIDEWLQPRLSFALQLGYHMAGGQRLIQAVLDIFCGKKLPSYLFNREAAFGGAAVGWMQEHLAGRSLLALGVSLSQAEGEGLQTLAASLRAEDWQITLLNLFHLAEQLDAQQEAKAFAALGRFVRSEWAVLFDESGAQTAQKVWQAVEWERVLNRLTPCFEVVGAALVQRRDLDALLSVPDGHFAQAWQQMRQWRPEEAQMGHALAAHLWNMVSPSCMATLTIEGRRLLLLIDVPGLVEERINALSPKMLETLMRGIAQPYFKRVERMGWLGAVVAVPATVVSRMLGGF